MVFLVRNKETGSTVLDVEFWLDRMDEDINLWYTRIRVTPIIEGMVDFVDRLLTHGGYDKGELKSDMYAVRDLAYWMNETCGNNSVVYDIAAERHYKKFLPHVREVLERFCDKYDLELNED